MAGFKPVKVRYKYDDEDITIIETMLAGIFRRSGLTDEKLEKERVDNTARFSAQFTENIFQDEYAILYELVVARRLTTGTWDVMEAVINENTELILSAPQVYLGKFDADFTDSDEFYGFISITKAAYESICDAVFTGSEHFRSSVSNFIEVYEKKYMRQCLNVMGAILGSPDPYVDYRGGRRREYFGFNGVKDFYTAEMARISALRGASSSRQFTVGSEWLNAQLDPVLKEEKARRREKLCEIGIPEIDSVWAGVCRTHMVGIIGPPKGGKTTLSAFIVHQLLKAGKKVAVWAMEGSAEESWINKLIAAECYSMSVNVTTKDLAKGLVDKTDEEVRAVTEATVAISQNENLSFIEETGYVEDFLDVIDGHYRVHNRFDCIVVDSLLNLQSKTGRKKTEYLSSAYISLKDYVEHKLNPASACIVTAQFKQEAIKDARNSVDPTFDETSGGETAETIRTPDDVIGVFGTPEQRDIQYTTIYHIASRHTELFKKVDVHALFGNSYFTSAD
jgi:RecA/RadA recombinase